MFPIENYNLITFHNLKIIYQHICNTKGISMENNLFSKRSGIDALKIGSVPTNTALEDDMSGLGTIQRAVLSAYNTSTAIEGLHTQTVLRMMQGRFQEREVKNTISWLITEGYLYNTIDDDHAKSTTSQ